MSGRFLDIPNEKIVEDYKRLNLIPICGEYYRNDYMGHNGNYCCPITCQLVANDIVNVDNILNMANPSLSLGDLAEEEWPDLNIFNEHGSSNKVSFLIGFDSSITSGSFKNKEYFDKGRELRALLFNNNNVGVSST